MGYPRDFSNIKPPENYEQLKKMGVVLKRAHYFITSGGRMMYKVPIEEQYITKELTVVNRKENWEIVHRNQYHQMSLFDDWGMGTPGQKTS